MDKQRAIFEQGAVERGVAAETATYIFDLMEKFAGYGFNKSHSAAYALLSYQTAWLKTHHRAAFMSAVLSADMDHTDKVVRLKHECDKRGSPRIEPPDVNASRYEFSVSGPDSLRYGLGAIKGVGQGVIEDLMAAREREGPFRSLMDLCARLDSQKANRRVFEALIRAGALDGLGANRATLMHQLPLAIKRAEQRARAAEAGQSDFFGLTTEAAPSAADEEDALPTETLPDWSDAERLAGEKETLGLYLTGHPIDEHLADLADLTSGRIADLAGAEPPPSGSGYRGPKIEATVAGFVIDVRRRGNRVSLELDDNSDRLEVTLFDEVFQQHRHIVAKDTVLVVSGTLRFDEFINGWRLTAKRLLGLDEALQQRAVGLVITWRNGERDFPGRLRSVLEPWRRGPCKIVLNYEGQDAAARLEFGDEWSATPSESLLRDLRRLAGKSNVRLVRTRVLDSA
jgi:DNA polymerase-3 subunit alpha